MHTTAPAVCILERHPTTAILPSYRRTRWVRLPQQQHGSPHVRGCLDSTLYIQVMGHVRGRKFVWPPGRACAARWPLNLRPDDVDRWTTWKPIDAAPRARFKLTRTLPQRVTPTAFGTTGRLGHRLRLHRRATLVGPRSAFSRMERQFPARNNGGGPGEYCRQLDSDSSDTLAHLALDWHATQAPVVQRKPGPLQGEG